MHMLRLCASEALLLRLLQIAFRFNKVPTCVSRKKRKTKARRARKNKASDAHKRNICVLIRVN